MSNLRLYTFCNMYLSSIQQGIQSAHVLGDMSSKYRFDQKSPLAERFWDWADNHKTMIVCNGGANQDIEEMYFQLEDAALKSHLPLPYECFHEDDMSLGGIMTSCGIVLPEEIFDAVDYRKALSLSNDIVPPDQAAARQFLSGSSIQCDDLQDTYFFIKEGLIQQRYSSGSPEHNLIKSVKSCSLAR